jgi:hypothetical protein
MGSGSEHGCFGQIFNKPEGRLVNEFTQSKNPSEELVHWDFGDLFFGVYAADFSAGLPNKLLGLQGWRSLGAQKLILQFARN